LECLIKSEQALKIDKASGSAVPVQTVSPSPAFIDLEPPATTDKKAKKKDRAKRHPSFCHLLKRSQQETPNVGVSNANRLFGSTSFHKGVNILLSLAERGAFIATSTNDLAAACLEMQTRALVYVNVLRMDLSKCSSLEVVSLKKEWVASGGSLKASLDANTVQGEALKKVKSKCDTLSQIWGAREREK